jgi:hypothetical protein
VHLSLFSRLTIGYLVIFLVVAMASASAVLQLRYFRDLTESILNIDNRMLDHEKILADLLLAQSRAEQKFIITRDETWYQQFVRLKSEFDGRLQSALALNDPAAASILKTIQRDSERYQQLVEDEARLVRAPTSVTRRRNTSRTKIVSSMRSSRRVRSCARTSSE